MAHVDTQHTEEGAELLWQELLSGRILAASLTLWEGVYMCLISDSLTPDRRQSSSIVLHFLKSPPPPQQVKKRNVLFVGAAQMGTGNAPEAQGGPKEGATSFSAGARFHWRCSVGRHAEAAGQHWYDLDLDQHLI